MPLLEEVKALQAEAASRAALYNLFADALARSLDLSWLNPHFQAKLKAGLPRMESRDEMLGALARATGRADVLQDLQLDFDALFIVPGPSLIFPFESCYRCRNIDGSFGRLWQEPAQDMYRILQEWGIKFAEGWDLIPDHIAVELFFMTHLCRLTADMAEKSDNRDQLEKLMEWQGEFFKTQLQPWVFELLANLENKAQTQFYRSLAKLIKAFLEEEQVMLAELD